MAQRRARGPAAARPPQRGRLPTLLFAGLFMLAFGGGGLVGGVAPIVLTTWRAVEVRLWEPVSAQVAEVKLDEHAGGEGGSTYAVRARYVYRVNGRDYESRRVGLLDWGSDNIGDWHHEWHARLNDARQREAPVMAWYDPARPERALLDRRPRWGMLAFHAVFGICFTAVGVGAAAVCLRVLRR